MVKGFIAIIGYALLLISNVTMAQQDAGFYQNTVNQYCVGCHNDTLKTATFSLQHVNANDLGADGESWEKVLRKLRAKAMPPSGMPRPDDATYESFVSFLESGLNQHAKQNPEPGRPSMRRLNRTEYVNAIRDLFAIDIDGDTLLPPDASMFNFDNIGGVLTLSPLLIERYRWGTDPFAIIDRAIYCRCPQGA
jgi:hypothetical protein